MIIYCLTVLDKLNYSRITIHYEIFFTAFKSWATAYVVSLLFATLFTDILQLVVINLIDSLVLSYPSLYVSALLLSLRSMLQLDLPTVNVLTKIDKVADRDPLPFNLEFYTEVHDLNYLLPYLEAEQRGESIEQLQHDADEDKPPPPPSRFKKLNEAITSLVNDFSLVAFEPLCVEDKNLMASLLHAADRSSGYAFGGTVEGANESIWSVAVSQDAVKVDINDVQERWVDRRDEMDEEERERWKHEGKIEREGEDQGNPVGDEDDLEHMAGMMTGNGIKVTRVAPKD
jgi:hypothetical protein